MTLQRNEREQRVAIFAPLFPPAFRGGGPIRSLTSLAGTAPEDIDFTVVSPNSDLGEKDDLPVPSDQWVNRPEGRVYYANTRSPIRLLRSMAAVRKTRPTLLHFNSFFNRYMTAFPLLLWRLGFWGRPILLLAPRGEFGDGALEKSSVPKRIYIRIFRAFGLDRDIIWHSTAPHETEAINELWGSEAKIILRENDTLLPRESTPPKQLPKTTLRMIFLGRIVEHKGLLIALQALKSLDFEVSLDVFGSAENHDYLEKCKRVARTLSPKIAVAFHGAVPPEKVTRILSDHDVLIMPTAGENFGHVIAEALSVSCIVLTTPHTPWNNILSQGGGLVVDRTVTDWRNAISELCALDADQVLAKRKSAGESYNLWTSESRPPHVWALAFDAHNTSKATGFH